MKLILNSILIGMMLFATQVNAREAVDPVVTASLSAITQLQKIDEGNYNLEEGYASIFISLVTQEQWSNQIGAVRGPLGAVVLRETLKGEYLTSLPGMPDGDYIILQFQTEFENKKESVETVTMILEESAWRLGGYFIK